MDYVHQGYILNGKLYYSWIYPDRKNAIALLIGDEIDLENFEGEVEFNFKSGRCFILNRFERIK